VGEELKSSSGRGGIRLQFGISSLLSWMSTFYPDCTNKFIILKSVDELMFIVSTFVLHAHFS